MVERNNLSFLAYLGLVAAVYGALSGDKIASFLMGIVSAVLDFIILYPVPSFEYYRYTDLQMVASLLTFVAIGIGLALMGLGGSFFGNYERGYDTAKSARFSVLFLVSGTFLSLFIVYGWPGYLAALPFRIL